MPHPELRCEPLGAENEEGVPPKRVMRREISIRVSDTGRGSIVPEIRE